MITILNCRQIDDSLCTIQFSPADSNNGHGGTFSSVKPQAGMLPVDGGVESLVEFTKRSISERLSSAPMTVDAAGALILPAGVDVHIHSRDPGLTHKEDWAAVARGGFKGGVAAVCDMPNTKPATMSRDAVLEKERVAAASGIAFGLYLGVGASNIQKVADLIGDPALPLCGLKVYYGQSTGDLMYADLEALGRAMPRDDHGRMIVFHSEDQCCIDHNIDLNRTKIEAMRSSRANRPVTGSDFSIHSDIRSSAAAHASTRTILKWAKGYGRPIHIAHLSTPVELELIAEAKAQGVKVSSEVAPHHILFSTDDYAELGSRLKINPPVRSPEEVRQLRLLVGQGAVECFATDHAPHTLAEKAADFDSCPSGAPALEYFYPLLARVAELTGLALAKAVAMGTSNPARLFGFSAFGGMDPGKTASFVWGERTTFRVSDKEVVSKCGWTPYHGMELPLRVAATWHRGRLVYRHGL